MNDTHCDHCYEKGYSDGESNRENDYVFALQDVALIPDDAPTTPHEFALWLNENWPFTTRPSEIQVLT